MGVTVSQALVTAGGSVSGVPGLVTFNDEGTAWTAAAEEHTGQISEIHLRLTNKSNVSLIGELQLVIPNNLRVEVVAADGVTGVGRSALDRWKFTMAGSHGNATPDLIITVKAGLTTGFTVDSGSYKAGRFLVDAPKGLFSIRFFGLVALYLRITDSPVVIPNSRTRPAFISSASLAFEAECRPSAIMGQFWREENPRVWRRCELLK